MRSGATPSRATSRSTSAATPCACARSLAQRQKATSPGRSACEHALRAAQRLLEAHERAVGVLAGEVAQVLRGGAAEALDGLVIVAGDRDVTRLIREQAQQERLGEARLLDVVGEDDRPAGGHARAHVWLGLEQAHGVQQQIAVVERPLAGEQRVVVGVELGELALAGRARALRVALAGQRVRPQRDVLGGDRLVLELVDAGDHAGQQRGRAPAEVVQLERELVDAVEQEREPVGRRGGDEERVQARLDGLLAQEQRAEGVGVVNGQLAPGVAEGVLDALAQRGVGAARGEDEDRFGRRALAYPPREALDERRRLAAARSADDEDRAGRGVDGALLGRREGAGHLPRVETHGLFPDRARS
jgi:hypothetical protein